MKTTTATPIGTALFALHSVVCDNQSTQVVSVEDRYYIHGSHSNVYHVGLSKQMIYIAAKCD